MRLSFSERVILRWLGDVNSRRMRATGKKPTGWHEQTFYKLVWLGLVNYNVRKSRAWLTPIGRRFYQEYIMPLAESEKERLMEQFEIMAEYKDDEEDVQDSLDPIDDDTEWDADEDMNEDEDDDDFIEGADNELEWDDEKGEWVEYVR